MPRRGSLCGSRPRSLSQQLAQPADTQKQSLKREFVSVVFPYQPATSSRDEGRGTSSSSMPNEREAELHRPSSVPIGLRSHSDRFAQQSSSGLQAKEGRHQEHNEFMVHPNLGPRDPRIAGSMEKLFHAWDADGDGKISRAEMSRIIRFVLNETCSEGFLDKLMLAADTNESGSIERDEFMTWLYDEEREAFRSEIKPSKISCAKSLGMVSALKKLFEAMDMNSNGKLEYEEFALAAKMADPDASLVDIASDFDILAESGNRKVTWECFLSSYSKLLDAIPRPVEEKVDMVLRRARSLTWQHEQSGKPHIGSTDVSLQELERALPRATMPQSRQHFSRAGSSRSSTKEASRAGSSRSSSKESHDSLLPLLASCTAENRADGKPRV